MSTINVYNVPGVHAEPSITLRPWLILQCRNGKRYAMGWNITHHEGRASTAIQSFDRNRMTLVTESGRVYKLEGEPGLDMDAAYVWNLYARVNGYEVVADVTGEYWADWDTKGKNAGPVDTRLAEVSVFLRNIDKPPGDGA